MLIQGVLREGLYACHPLFSIGILLGSLSTVIEHGEIHNNIEHFFVCKENICISYVCRAHHSNLGLTIGLAPLNQ